jgi:hypothetical protein
MLDIYINYAIIEQMIRRMVYFTEEQARDIKLKAMREQRHEAEVVRELVSEGLKTSQTKQQVSTGESLLRLARIGGKGPADLSSRIDDYLYGEDN